MNLYERERIPRIVLWMTVAVLCFCLWGCVGSEPERAAWSRLDAAQQRIVALQQDPAVTPEAYGAAQKELLDAAAEYAQVQKDEVLDSWRDFVPDVESIVAVLLGIMGLNGYRNRKARIATP